MSNLSSSRRWSGKFRDAVRGVRVGVRGQSSFRVHLAMTVLVSLAAVLLRVSLVEWCVLLICIGAVLAAELFNSSLESLGRAITNQHHDGVRDALDSAAGAVLLISAAAAVVGATIFVFRLGLLLGWWAGYLMV